MRKTRDGQPSGEDGRRLRSPTLRLVDAESDRGDGILLVFNRSGHEESWLLDQTSVTEFFALVLEGRMDGDRRVRVEADVTLEVADEAPLLCVAGRPLRTCVALGRSRLEALRREIDHILSEG